MKRLIAKGADCTIINNEGQQPLLIWTERLAEMQPKMYVRNNIPVPNADNPIDGVRAEIVDVARKMIRVGANPNHKDCNGQTALHVATENANFDLVQLLLEHNAD